MSKERTEGVGEPRRSYQSGMEPGRKRTRPSELQLSLDLFPANVPDQPGKMGRPQIQPSTEDAVLLHPGLDTALRPAPEMTRLELIDELSTYLRAEPQSLLDPNIREFSEEETQLFTVWVDALTDEELVEQVELRSEMFTKKIRRLTERK